MVSWLGGPRFTPLSNTWLYAGCYYLFANECCVFNYVLHGVLTFLELRVVLIWGWIGVRLGKYGNCLRRNQTQNMTLPDLRESDILLRAPCNNLGRSCPPPLYWYWLIYSWSLHFTVYSIFILYGWKWLDEHFTTDNHHCEDLDWRGQVGEGWEGLRWDGWEAREGWI